MNGHSSHGVGRIGLCRHGARVSSLWRQSYPNNSRSFRFNGDFSHVRMIDYRKKSDFTETGRVTVDKGRNLRDRGWRNFSGRIDCSSRNARLPTVRSCKHNAEILPHYSSFHSLRKRKARNGHLMVGDILYYLAKDLKKFPNHEGRLVNKIDPQL